MFRFGNPFPAKFGGNGHKVIADTYQALRAARPDILRTDGGISDAEDKTTARALAVGDRAIARRVSQRDPRAASEYARPGSLSRLERLERIYGIVPQSGMSLRDRRQAVFVRATAYTSNTRQAVETAMVAIFGSWFDRIVRLSLSDIAAGSTAAWPGGNGADIERPGTANASAWQSALLSTLVYINPPANVSQSDIAMRTKLAAETLEILLPAYMVYAVVPSPSAGGFTLDSDLLDLGSF